jgi:hypothetical protein
MKEINCPVPVPFVVLVGRSAVGDGFRLQQTPFADTLAPPSLITFPPALAESHGRFETETLFVITEGSNIAVA